MAWRHDYHSSIDECYNPLSNQKWKYCPVCCNHLESNCLYCPKCGRQIDTLNSLKKKEPEHAICTNCNTHVKNQALYCHQCGVQYIPPTPAPTCTCGTLILENAAWCVNCGEHTPFK